MELPGYDSWKCYDREGELMEAALEAGFDNVEDFLEHLRDEAADYDRP